MYIFYKVIFDTQSNEASETEVFSVRIDLIWRITSNSNDTSKNNQLKSNKYKMAR